MLKLIIKDNVKREIELNKPKISIGRDANNDVVLNSGVISGFHAEIHVDGNRIFLIDLGSTNGTFVDGKRIVGRQEIKPWQKIKFADIKAEVIDTEGRRPTTVMQVANISTASTSATSGSDETRTTKWELRGITYPVVNKSFLIKDKTIMGRDADCDIVIPSNMVSRNHAEVFFRGQNLMIRDLGSTNGTFVNGVRISKETILKNGDEIKIDEVSFKVIGPEDDKGKTTIHSAVDVSKTTVRPSVEKNEVSYQATATTYKTHEQGNKTTTSGSKQEARNASPWVFGLAGFIIVILVVAGIYYFKNSSNPIDEAKLQGGIVWSHHLPGMRTMPATPVIADINGDSMLDVIVGDASGFLLALDGEKGLKIFDAQIADRIIAPLIALDLTGDKKADIVACSTSGKVFAFNGKGQKLWESDPNLKAGEIVNRPVAADLNNDGIPDIIVPTTNRGLVALDGNRGWLIWDTKDIFKGKIICAPIKADVNHDGLMDFVAVTQNGHVVAITSKGSKVWKLWEANVPPVYYASPVYLKDGNKGLIIIPTDKQGIIALNAENGRLAWTSPIAERFFASPVAVNANSDNVQDVALVAMNGDIHVLDGATGDEIWSLAIGTDVQATPALFDLNKDGLKDLIILDTSGRLICVDMARGRISLVIKVDGADSFIASPVLGDVNGDGLLDVIAASKNGNISDIFLNRSVPKGSVVWPVFQGRM